jgi:hypothetical protein
MLVKIGALTEEQLKQVLAAQSIYGGKFGTNLVEMGFVREEDLAVVLSEKLGAPFVDATELDAIPKQVLDVIPLEMVQRYTVCRSPSTAGDFFLPWPILRISRRSRRSASLPVWSSCLGSVRS